MREPIKIDTTSLQVENIVQSQDNLSHIMTLIGNVLREFPNNEGFSFGLHLLQLTSEKRNQLLTKL